VGRPDQEQEQEKRTSLRYDKKVSTIRTSVREEVINNGSVGEDHHGTFNDSQAQGNTLAKVPMGVTFCNIAFSIDKFDKKDDPKISFEKQHDGQRRGCSEVPQLSKSSIGGKRAPSGEYIIEGNTSKKKPCKVIKRKLKGTKMVVGEDVKV
jgi:hypothetical protein